MSFILDTVYNSLSAFLIANKINYQIRRFENLGDRILTNDLSNLYLSNFEHNTLQYDPWFFQRPTLIIHDQEPMMFTLQRNSWLRFNFNITSFDDRTIILTSELNSKELDEFCNLTGAQPCYWFSNGALALEWYQNGRWNLDNLNSLSKPKRLRYKFSAMNRLIDQQRLYRPIISRLLMEIVDNQYLRLSCNLTDPVSKRNINEMDYPGKYRYLFNKIDMSSPILLNVMRDDLASDGSIRNKSHSISGSYFNRVFCHIVTETLFLDDTLHLTEKSLRPIVNQRPFLILGPPGSISLLKRYGFMTFDKYWSESYDNISDPWERLEAVMAIVEKLNHMSLDDMENMLIDMRDILQHNFDHFYNRFKDIIFDELVDNLRSAVQIQKNKTPNGWMIQRIKALSEARLQGMLNGPIYDELPNSVLYESKQLNEQTKIDQNLARFLVQHLGIDKKASKEEILASVMALF